MKQYFGLILTTLSLVAVMLFFLLLIQGQESLIQEQDTHEISDEEPVATEESIEPVGVEDESLSPTFSVSLQYNNYPITYTYFLIEQGKTNIYAGPDLEETVLRETKVGEKLNYVETVSIQTGPDQTARWYHVTWKVDGRAFFGFVESSKVSKRVFQFEKMEEAVKRAEEYASRGPLTYINNYQNFNGYAPRYHGETVDADQNRRSQSAPGYLDPKDLDEFVYLGDGTLIRYYFSTEDFAKIEVVSTGKRYYVPKKYIPTGEEIIDLTKVIAIDRTNQNEVVYEKINGEWTVISCTLATTGATNQYALPTPLGYFYGIEKRDQFQYYEDGTTTIQGYAPYAIRFAGGAYVHGVPVNYRYTEEGQRITPPTQEYSGTIGTIPLSHKCVRNFTSHAKFLYDWHEAGKTIVIVID